MKYFFEKNMRIMMDIVYYCRKLGGREFDIKFFDDKEQFRFTVECKPINFCADEIEFIEKELNRPRLREIEQNYWGLSGEVEKDIELTLIGRMVDEAKVDFKDGLLKIEVIRKP